jgi:hypothetical protein
MAKQLIRSYVLVPGTIGTSAVKIPGKWDLNQILVITDTTNNTFLYNFADPTFSGTSVTFTRNNDPAMPQILQNTDGFTTINLRVDTTGYAGHTLQIFVERNEIITRPWPMGTDAFERTRMSAPTSMLDADFEYGLQPTKWLQLELLRSYPSIYEVPGTDINPTSITTDFSASSADPNINSLISVTTDPTQHNLSTGSAVTIKGLLSTSQGFSKAEGTFVVNSVTSVVSFTYYAKGRVGSAVNESLVTPYSVVRRGGFYTGAAIGSATFSVSGSGAAATGTVTVTFANNHGLIPGATIYVILTSDTGVGGNNHTLCQGPFFVQTVPGLAQITYSARNVGTITGTPLGAVYARPDCFFNHRAFDGGVAIGTGGAAHGTQAARQSKKYIRYQSGKSINYNTGVVFAPNYDLRSVTATSVTVGSIMYVTTDDLDHHLQAGAVVNLSGINTAGYNGDYVVGGIIDDRTFTCTTTATLASVTATFAQSAIVSMVRWHGSTVRTGTFDDQNGMYYQFDGQQMSIGLRTSTRQIAGLVTAQPDNNLLIGTNTRFNEQVVAGDRIVVRGMTHVVTSVSSSTWLYMNPDYRGSNTSTNVRISRIADTVVPQSQWNQDRCDGTNSPFNPSGYLIQPNKMQMIGLQWTWYGAGFIDWMLRGPEGNYITVHRIKNSNVNSEAYMRTGNMAVRYEVINESAKSSIGTYTMSASDLSMTVTDVTFFPSTGTVYIDNELISFTGRNTATNQLTGLTRASTLTVFTNATLRNFTAGVAATHNSGTGVVLVSQTASPVISHWGSAYLQDGGFDQDRGYIFNYQSLNVISRRRKTTAFGIRLAPSVSNATVGDLGARELINRAQLLLQGIEVTAGTAGANQAIVIEGVLNPSNYPTTVTNITWITLNSSGLQTGQPSFSQIALGSSILFDNTATYTTTLGGATTNSGTFLLNVVSTASMRIGDAADTVGLSGGTLITSFSGTNWVGINNPVATDIPNGATLLLSRNFYAVPGEQVFSFITSPANRDTLDLSPLKELTNTPLGGRGTYPNGPDTLFINVYVTQGQPIPINLNLRWGEAQA